MSNLRPLLIALLIILILLAGGCAGGRTKSPSKTRPASAGAERRDATRLAAKAVANLGSEKSAVFAVLSAWDRGYALDQIIQGIIKNRLRPRGDIKGLRPAGRPQNYLKLSTRPVLLASTDITATPVATKRLGKAEIGELVEARKAQWTIWLLGAIEKGYSVEQITEFMLENKEPAVFSYPDEYIGPVITQQLFDQKTRKPIIDVTTGKPQKVVVRPAFPTKSSVFDPIRVGSAEEFTSDLAEDFEALVDGKTPVRPRDGAKPANEAPDTPAPQYDKKDGPIYQGPMTLVDTVADLEHREKVRITIQIRKDGGAPGHFYKAYDYPLIPVNGAQKLPKPELWYVYARHSKGRFKGGLSPTIKMSGTYDEDVLRGKGGGLLSPGGDRRFVLEPFTLRRLD